MALGRVPESAEVVEDKLSQPKAALLPDFFSSGEFKDNVRTRALAAAPFRGEAFAFPPDPDLRSWATRFAPLSAVGAEAVTGAASWPRLYHALFSDPVFIQAVLTEAARAENPAFLIALDDRDQVESLGQLSGQIELITGSEIRGWAVDARNPDRRLALELLVEGRPTSVAVTELYRPELQARFGGDGRVGFTLPRAVADGAGSGSALVRDTASGVVLQRFHLTAPQGPPLDAAFAIRKELAELRGLLERIEARLPAFQEAFAFSLENYDVYARTYYGQEDHGTDLKNSLDISVILDAVDISTPALEAALTRLARQDGAPADVVVIHPGGDRALEVEARLDDWRKRSGRTRLKSFSAAGGTWADAILQAAALADTDRLLLLRRGARLAPDAVTAIFGALAAGASLVYADADEIDVRPDGQEGGRRNPALRTDFDPELLLQGIDLGDVLGLRRELLLEQGLRVEYGAEALFDLILRIHEAVGRTGIVHVPRVLSHSDSATPAQSASAERLAAVRNYLGPEMDVAPHHDVLGAHVPSALRVKRRTSAGTRAAIIIPTRDRLDLLGPCIASIAAAVTHNRAAAEILVVDNQSSAPATRAFLESYARLAALRVVEHDGAFNWALMNDRAAQVTDADVLIFLNNDTVVATTDWCDELCSQALRPEVGVVGARLLYEDGSIQHAGVVLGGWHAFAAHEGMGSPGSDAGHLGRHALVRQVSAVTGACLATRAEVFHRLGGFDDVTFPVEANDTDYCLRARAAGLDVLYDPYCTLYHFESKSRGYDLDAERRARADAAGAALRERWGAQYRSDPFYNPHFDRLSRPFARLGPPPPKGERRPSGAVMTSPDVPTSRKTLEAS